MDSGIYLIKNIKIGRVYVGSAIKIDKRFYEHRWALRHNQHRNIHLQRAWNKYGEDSFVFEPFLICEPVMLVEYEQAIIDAFGQLREKTLFNISPIAGSSLGRRHSADTKIKIGLASKGRWSGKTHTEETKEKIRLGNLGVNIGRKHSAESRRKMSEFRTGKKFTAEHRKNLSTALKRYCKQKAMTI